jgi:hypothetical protein
MMDIDALELPLGTHAIVLTGRDVVTGEQLAYPVVWADRSDSTCPRCGQPVAQVVAECPVGLNTGAGQDGQIEELSQQHGCGEWLSVDWAEVSATGPLVDPTEDDVLATARELAARLADDLTTQRERIRARLRVDLRDGLARLAEPLAEDETAEDRAAEVSAGNETEPGLYLEDGQWLAWDYDPDGSGDTITVYASEITAEDNRE